jgi:hypothetical protein
VAWIVNVDRLDTVIIGLSVRAGTNHAHSQYVGGESLHRERLTAPRDLCAAPLFSPGPLLDDERELVENERVG